MERHYRNFKLQNFAVAVVGGLGGFVYSTSLAPLVGLTVAEAKARLADDINKNFATPYRIMYFIIQSSDLLLSLWNNPSAVINNRGQLTLMVTNTTSVGFMNIRFISYYPPYILDTVMQDRIII